jgi:formylglycine-generating enzyme required for sulfatase activity
VRQFQDFLRENPQIQRGFGYIQKFSPDLDGPQIQVSWYQAAAYCNWLSRKERLPQCCEPNSQGQYIDGMASRADALQRVGYRLPTEAEWEYACRAGAGTSRYYGSSVDLLGRYEWSMATSPDRTHPCSRFLPNDLGLFDMLGNVCEWSLDRALFYSPDRKGTISDDKDMKIYFNALGSLRGGSFYSRPADVRSAGRYWTQRSNRGYDYGFRPCRTFP